MSNYRDKINLDDLFERKKKLSTLRTDIYKKNIKQSTHKNQTHVKTKEQRTFLFLYCSRICNGDANV